MTVARLGRTQTLDEEVITVVAAVLFFGFPQFCRSVVLPVLAGFVSRMYPLVAREQLEAAA